MKKKLKLKSYILIGLLPLLQTSCMLKSESQVKSEELLSEIQNPNLKSINRETFINLAEYSRKQVVTDSEGEVNPIAWSMINQSCQNRALGLEFTIHTAGPEIENRSPEIWENYQNRDDVSVPDAIKEEKNRIEQEVQKKPIFESGSINVAGPLATNQTLFDSQKNQISKEPIFFYWPYHHGVIMNVDEEYKVMDLSVGDEPIAVNDWLQSFLPEGMNCPQVSQNTYDLIWNYWNTTFQFGKPFVELPEGTPYCGYTLSERFRFDWKMDKELLVSQLHLFPFTMNVQTKGFQTILRQAGYDLKLKDAATITSTYEGSSLKGLCERNGHRLNFCTYLKEAGLTEGNVSIKE